MLSEKNPFEILGLNPSAIKGLPDEKVWELVKSMYRSLIKIHHVDAGGTEVRNKELSEAFGILENPEFYTYWKSLFLLPKQEQRKRNIKTVESISTEISILQRRLIDFWTARAGRVTEDHFSVERLPSMRIVVYDVMKAVVRDKNGRSSNLLIPPDQFFEIEVIAGENLILRAHRLSRIEFTAENIPPGLPKSWINGLTGDKKKFASWGRVGQPVDMNNFSLIGAIPFDSVNPILSRHFDRFFPDDLNVSYKSTEMGLDKEEFTQHFMLRLSPYFRVDSLLFAVRKDQLEPPRFHLVGKVVRASPI